jgi:hypothetical protein
MTVVCGGRCKRSRCLPSATWKVFIRWHRASRLGLAPSFRVDFLLMKASRLRSPRYRGSGASRKHCRTVHLFSRRKQCSSMTYEGVSLESLHGWEV